MPFTRYWNFAVPNVDNFGIPGNELKHALPVEVSARFACVFYFFDYPDFALRNIASGATGGTMVELDRVVCVYVDTAGHVHFARVATDLVNVHPKPHSTGFHNFRMVIYRITVA